MTTISQDDTCMRCNQPCEYPHMLADARGIPIGQCCELCEDELKSGYRPEIFEDPSYWAEESIEPEQGFGINHALGDI